MKIHTRGKTASVFHSETVQISTEISTPIENLKIEFEQKSILIGINSIKTFHMNFIAQIIAWFLIFPGAYYKGSFKRRVHEKLSL
jgi:hypothetical protein